MGLGENVHELAQALERLLPAGLHGFDDTHHRLLVRLPAAIDAYHIVFRQHGDSLWLTRAAASRRPSFGCLSDCKKESECEKVRPRRRHALSSRGRSRLDTQSA